MAWSWTLWGLCLLTLALGRTVLLAAELEPVYWNSSNPLFHFSKGLVVYPRIGDRLDVVCPRAEYAHSSRPLEYYKLYLVQERQADLCSTLHKPPLLLNCSRPQQEVKYTVKFQEVSPHFFGLEFKRRKNYYVISTSVGTLEGLDNRMGGACQTLGMKLVMKVGQDNEKPVDGDGARTTPQLAPQVALIVGVASGAVLFMVFVILLVLAILRCRRRRGKTKHASAPPLPGLTGGTTPVSCSGGGSLGSGPGSGSTTGSMHHHHLHHHPLGALVSSPKHQTMTGGAGGTEPSDIIIPLRAGDGPGAGYCPHYEKVSGDYGHPVYIVQEIPPQSPSVYYKV
uniref:ephrin-B1-like isoform X2 n=1 Tax=Myxine glutinosa TaxID=7769 RepID=UPI00358E7B8F